MTHFNNSRWERQVSVGYEGEMVAVQEFLNHLVGGTSGYFELTYIQPAGLEMEGPHIINECYQLGREKPDWDHVAAMNAKGYGVYYGLTTKKRRALPYRRSNENAAAWVSCLWAEIDMKDRQYDSLEAAYRGASALEPTAIIHSGGGYHALWRITPVMVTAENRLIIKEILRGLAVAINGDTSVAELARVFRLPGTINTKPERHGARCEIVWWLPGELTLEQFSGYRLLARPVERPLERHFPRPKPEEVPGYINWYLDANHPEGDRNNSLNWTAYKMYGDGFTELDATRLLLGKAMSEGLSETEARRTIISAFSGKKGTPSYVSQRDQLRMRAGDAVGRLGGAK